MRQECIFLTRGELHIHSRSSLSVHLKPSDRRLKDITRLMCMDRLKIVTINPKIDLHTSFFKENWYLIPTLEYTGTYDHAGYTHISFKYRLEGEYKWDKEGVRKLKTEEIDIVRKTLMVPMEVLYDFPTNSYSLDGT